MLRAVPVLLAAIAATTAPHPALAQQQRNFNTVYMCSVFDAKPLPAVSCVADASSCEACVTLSALMLSPLYVQQDNDIRHCARCAAGHYSTPKYGVPFLGTSSETMCSSVADPSLSMDNPEQCVQCSSSIVQNTEAVNIVAECVPCAQVVCTAIGEQVVGCVNGTSNR